MGKLKMPKNPKNPKPISAGVTFTISGSEGVRGVTCSGEIFRKRSGIWSHSFRWDSPWITQGFTENFAMKTDGTWMNMGILRLIFKHRKLDIEQGSSEMSQNGEMSWNEAKQILLAHFGCYWDSLVWFLSTYPSNVSIFPWKLEFRSGSLFILGFHMRGYLILRALDYFGLRPGLIISPWCSWSTTRKAKRKRLRKAEVPPSCWVPTDNWGPHDFGKLQILRISWHVFF